MYHLFAGARAGARPGLRVALASLAALTLLAVSGCNLINPDEAVPAYLSIAQPVYAPAPGDPAAAAASVNVVSAFVYASDLFIGVFDLPAKVPVLQAGDVSVRVAPAIYPDGQRATRVVYPFYKDLKTRVRLVPGQVLPVAPAVAYNPATTHLPFDIEEEFAPDVPAFTLSSLASAPYTLEAGVADDAAHPQVGRVRGITGRTDVFFLESVWKGPLPGRSAPVYLELDCRSTMPFQVGLTYNSDRVGDLTVYPSDHWTKLYVNLSEEIGRIHTTNASAQLSIYIEGFPTGVAGDFFAVDNIRLVRPKD